MNDLSRTERTLDLILVELRTLNTFLRLGEVSIKPPSPFQTHETNAQRTEFPPISEARMQRAKALLGAMPAGMRLSEVEEALSDTRALAAHNARSVQVTVTTRRAPAEGSDKRPPGEVWLR